MRLPSLVSALVLVGCVDSGDEGMIVLNNTALSGDTCALSGDPGQPFLPHGYINAQSPNGYILTPLVQSRIAQTIGTGMGMGTQVDPNARTILFRGADVILTLKQGTTDSMLGAFSVLFSGSLPPNGTANVAFEVMTPQHIRAAVGGATSGDVRAEVEAKVTIKGTLGGDEVTASPFYYPIGVCTDCIVQPACLMEEQNPNPCNPYQDGTYCLSIITP